MCDELCVDVVEELQGSHVEIVAASFGVAGGVEVVHWIDDGGSGCGCLEDMIVVAWFFGGLGLGGKVVFEGFPSESPGFGLGQGAGGGEMCRSAAVEAGGSGRREGCHGGGGTFCNVFLDHFCLDQRTLVRVATIRGLRTEGCPGVD